MTRAPSKNSTLDSSNSDGADKKRASAKVGARGLLVLGLDKQTYSYFPDNENTSWTQFAMTQEAAAILEQRGLSLGVVEMLTKSLAPVALCQRKPRTFLVNLDAFKSLEKPKRPELKKQELELAENEDLYIMHEEGNYYTVPGHALEELDPGDTTYAQALVARGVVAAALPANALPVGTHCVLLNLPEFVP